jgi:hypothetical protein
MIKVLVFRPDRLIEAYRFQSFFFLSGSDFAEAIGNWLGAQMFCNGWVLEIGQRNSIRQIEFLQEHGVSRILVQALQ